MIEMVVPLVANGFLPRIANGASIASSKASFVAAAIHLVAPVVDKNHETGAPTGSVFLGELMAVLVCDARLSEVSVKPIGIIEGLLEYLEICDHLRVHLFG